MKPQRIAELFKFKTLPCIALAICVIIFEDHLGAFIGRNFQEDYPTTFFLAMASLSGLLTMGIFSRGLLDFDPFELFGGGSSYYVILKLLFRILIYLLTSSMGPTVFLLVLGLFALIVILILLWYYSIVLKRTVAEKTTAQES